MIIDMGFNIGVLSNTGDFECDKFIDRRFYNWVVEFNSLGEKSCIIQIGKYFNLDLKPLTDLVYIGYDDDDIEYVYGLQNTDFLIQLVSDLIDNIKSNKSFIDNFKGAWKSYVTRGDLLEDLNILKEILECFKSKGNNEVLLTAM